MQATNITIKNNKKQYKTGGRASARAREREVLEEGKEGHDDLT